MMILIMVHFYSACFMALDIYNEKQHPCGLHVRIYILFKTQVLACAFPHTQRHACTYIHTYHCHVEKR